jgi:hypothetical protein
MNSNGEDDTGFDIDFEEDEAVSAKDSGYGGTGSESGNGVKMAYR